MKYTHITKAHLENHSRPARARITALADELGTTPQTLRRRLVSEGTSWDEIRWAELHRRFQRMAGLQWQQIASALGYSHGDAALRSAKRARQRAADQEKHHVLS
jgi:hypothetical protein